MHALAAFFQLVDTFLDYTSGDNIIEPLAAFTESFQILLIILQVYNFIVIATYFADAEPFKDLTIDE